MLWGLKACQLAKGKHLFNFTLLPVSQTHCSRFTREYVALHLRDALIAFSIASVPGHSFLSQPSYSIQVAVVLFYLFITSLRKKRAQLFINPDGKNNRLFVEQEHCGYMNSILQVFSLCWGLLQDKLLMCTFNIPLTSVPEIQDKISTYHRAQYPG